MFPFLFEAFFVLLHYRLIHSLECSLQNPELNVTKIIIHPAAASDLSLEEIVNQCRFKNTSSALAYSIRSTKEEQPFNCAVGNQTYVCITSIFNQSRSNQTNCEIQCNTTTEKRKCKTTSSRLNLPAVIAVIVISLACTAVAVFIFKVIQIKRHREQIITIKPQYRLSKVQMPGMFSVNDVGKATLTTIDDPAESEMRLGVFSATMVIMKRLVIEKAILETQNNITRQIATVRLHIQSENVLVIYGICCDIGRTVSGLILEYCYRGTLKDVVESSNYSRDLSQIFLSDLIAGLEAIHSSQHFKCHGSLMSKNCFVNVHFTVKISLVKSSLSSIRKLKNQKSDSTTMETSGRKLPKSRLKKIGPAVKRQDHLLWTAPELLTRLNIDEYRDGDLEDLVDQLRNDNSEMLQQADIYSLGIIANECFEVAGTFPVEKQIQEGKLTDDSSLTIIKKLVESAGMPHAGTLNSIRPDTSWIIHPEYLEPLLTRCWLNDWQSRPSLLEIDKVLRKARLSDPLNSEEHFEQYTKMIHQQEVERNEVIDAMHTLSPEKIQGVVDSLMPRQISDSFILNDGKVEMHRYQSATILFGDCTGFSRLVHAQLAHADLLVVTLNQVFTKFDTILMHPKNEGKLYKVETIGEQYMIISGLPNETEDHAEILANIALDMMDRARDMNSLHRHVQGNNPAACLEFRIGLHTGPVVAGLTGHTLPRYRMIGDTVNFASRISVYSYPGMIHLSEPTANILLATHHFMIEPRGTIEIKGKGMRKTFWLRCRDGWTPAAQTDDIILQVEQRDKQNQYKMPKDVNERILLMRIDKHGKLQKDGDRLSVRTDKFPENVQMQCHISPSRPQPQQSANNYEIIGSKFESQIFRTPQKPVQGSVRASQVSRVARLSGDLNSLTTQLQQKVHSFHKQQDVNKNQFPQSATPSSSGTKSSATDIHKHDQNKLSKFSKIEAMKKRALDRRIVHSKRKTKRS